MRSPKAIFFDLDETLIENTIPIQKLFAGMYAQFADELGVGKEQLFFAALRQHAASVWNEMFLREQSPEQQLRDCFAAAVTAVLPAEHGDLGEQMYRRFVELTRKNICFQEGAEHTLQELKQAGFITGVITNGIEELQMGKIRKLAIDCKVDHVIVSAQARAHKPDARVFHLALERSGVEANQAWQIGDHATNDVAGAIRVGMSGIFYDPSTGKHESAFAELEERPTHVISRLDQVLQLVDA
ncbi:MAG: HAD family hydrolase [Arenicella sp.]|nr:HAD family hydrolase [Arenicella sp.]